MGELMGINILFFDKSSNGEILEGIGFVILIVFVIKVMEKLICDGWVICGYIGIIGEEYLLFNVSGNSGEWIYGIKVNKILLSGLVVNVNL